MDKITVCHNYLRFEIKLYGSKIKEALGYNSVYDVTDEVIYNYFNTFIQKNVVDEYDKYCEKMSYIR